MGLALELGMALSIRLLSSLLALATPLLLTACDDGSVELEDSYAAPASTQSWPEKVDRFIDRDYLQRELGPRLPARSSIIAAKVLKGTGGVAAYQYFEAHGASRPVASSFQHGFSPASSVKLLAAIGAYEVADAKGIDVNAVAPLYAWETPNTSVPTLAERAFNSITYLDQANRANGDFDRLVEFAGPDFFHDKFFVAERGFTEGFLQNRYQYDPNLPYLLDPTMNLCDGLQCEPWRASCSAGDDAVDCPNDYVATPCRGGKVDNCTSLFNLSDAMRRTVLDDELAANEVWRMSKDKRDDLKDFVAAPRYQYSEDGARLARNETPIVYHKYGENSLGCVDSVLVDYPISGDRFLFAIEAESISGCGAFLKTMSQAIIEALGRAPSGMTIRPDFGTWWTASVSESSVSGGLRAQVMVPNATRAEVEVNGQITSLMSQNYGGAFAANVVADDSQETATLRAYAGSKLIGERLVDIRR